MKRIANRPPVFPAAGTISRLALTVWLGVLVAYGVLCGTGECDDGGVEVRMDGKHDSAPPLSSESHSLAERWQAESRVAKIRAKVVTSLAEHNVDEALAAQHELVSALKRLAGPGHWRTKDEEPFLAELEQVAKLTAKERTRYLDAYHKVIEGKRHIALAEYTCAQDLLESAVPNLTTLVGEDSISLAAAIENLGLACLATDQPTTAKELFVRAAEIAKPLVGEDHPDYANCLSQIGAACLRSGDPEQAEAFFKDALTRARRVFGTESFQYANGLCHLSGALLRRKQFLEAEALCMQALSIAERVQGPESLFAPSCLLILAKVSIAYSEYDKAESNLQRCLRIYERRLPPGGSPGFAAMITAVLDTYASLLRDLGRDVEADGLEDRAREMREQMCCGGKGHNRQSDASADRR